MKKLRCFTVCIVLLSALILTACGWAAEDYAGNFENRLQGKWKTNDESSAIYFNLTITSNSITIEDLSDGWSANKNLPTHPFKDFVKGAPLKGYSEKIDNNNGIIYIEEFGDLHEGIPYKYDSLYNQSSFDRTEILQFTFPSPEVQPNRPETLIKYTE